MLHGLQQDNLPLDLEEFPIASSQTLIRQATGFEDNLDATENIVEPSDYVGRMVSKAYTNKSLETNMRPAI